MATIEQQRAMVLAQARRRRAEAGVAASQPSSDSSFLNRGIASVAGAPVDLMQSGVNALVTARGPEPLADDASLLHKIAMAFDPGRVANQAVGLVGGGLRAAGAEPLQGDPFGGSESIESAFRSVGVGVPARGEKPTTLNARVARGIGEAGGAILPFGAISKAAGATKALGAGTIGAEVVSGAGAGVGAHVAEETAPDNQILQFLAEIVGGIAAPAGIAAARLPSKAIKRVASEALFPFTETGGRIRAEKRIQALVPNAEAAAKKLGEPTISKTTPARKIGDERLIALEDAVRGSDINVDESIKRIKAGGEATLRSELERIKGSGSAADTKEALTGRQERFSKLIDDRVTKATDIVDEKISNLTPKMREAQASTVARQELDSALSDIRVQERALWEKIPSGVLAEKKVTTTAYEQLIKDTPRAQQGDIPKSLMKRFFAQPAQEKLNWVNGRGEPLLGKSAPKTEKLSELQGLRSKLLEESRQAKADGKFNKARIHDNLADAVLEDLGAVSGRVQGEIGQTIRDALDFSRKLNKKFTQGEIGKILGSAKQGGARVAPELTLNKLIGTGGVKGDLGAKKLLEAADSPELRESVEDFLKEKLEKVAIKDGVVNPKAARKFMKENNDVLNRFPALKKSIGELEESTEKFLSQSKRAKTIQSSLVSESKNEISKFINAPIEKEFDVIVNSRNPSKFAGDLVARAAKDKTGAAQQGLKASAIDFAIGKSLKDGDISGKALLNLVNKNKGVNQALSAVLSSREMQKIRQIGSEYKAFQALSTKNVGGLLNDLPANLVETPIRVLALRTGAKFGKGTSGASLFTANMFSQKAKKYVEKFTNDKARQLIVQAVSPGGDELMKTLLMNTTTKPARVKAARRLEAWLLGPGLRLLEDDRQESEPRK